jgi:hypothetical protein
MRLTQDLLGLFTQYNIPSDLLSFGGRPFLQSNHKIDEVKRHVEEMHDLIDEIKVFILFSLSAFPPSPIFPLTSF